MERQDKPVESKPENIPDVSGGEDEAALPPRLAEWPTIEEIRAYRVVHPYRVERPLRVYLGSSRRLNV